MPTTLAPPPPAATLPARTLTRADRCDASQAEQAYVRVGWPRRDGGTTELLLCSHHYTVNEHLLWAAGCSIDDQRDHELLAGKPISGG